MSDENRDDSQFVELLSKSQVRLRAYALSLVRIPSDADDVLQNACMTLWKKRHEYHADRDFFRWACGVVLIEVLRYRRKAATDKLMFDEALLNTLAADYLERLDVLDRQRDLLPGCLAKLSDRDRWLLETRYRWGVTVADIARRTDSPLSTIYSWLARTRSALYRCVQTSLAQESHPSQS